MSEAEVNLTPIETQPPPMAPDISAEPATSWIDWAVVAAVLAVSLWFLYSKLWAKRGGCSGCGATGKSGCSVQRPSRQAQARGRVAVDINRIQRRG